MPDNPNPPSPERLALEAAIFPKINAISGAILRWRAGIRGDDQMPPAIPYQGGLMGAGVNGAKVPNPQPRMPPPPETGAAYGNPIQQALMAQQREGRQDPLADYPKSWPEYGEKFAKSMEEKNAMDWAMGFGPGAVKLKGGMWHPGAHQDLAEPLYANLVRGREHELPAPGEGNIAGSAGSWEAASPEGKWANKVSKDYLNKHAGTAEDPLKDVWIPHEVGGLRRWEDLTDKAVGSRPARGYDTVRLQPNGQWEGPKMRPDWIHEKVPPNEPIWDLNRNAKQGEGHDASSAINALTSYMGHVGDYMRNVPVDQLGRYDLVRAVREVAAQDAARAKKMNSVEGKSEGTLVHKEYPDKFRWVEVGKHEGPLPKEYTVSEQYKNHWVVNKDNKVVGRAGDSVGGAEWPHDNLFNTKEEAESAVRRIVGGDALKREGDAMGHCVGGYCDYVESGKSKIYSLRDPKGGSHVTIEVTPRTKWDMSGSVSQKAADALNNLDPFIFKAYNASFQRSGEHTMHYGNHFWPWLKEKRPEIYAKLEAENAANPPAIQQIKGKQNLSPSKEYLPYVQDFVKSGKWGHVGDFEHTGLVKIKDEYKTADEALQLWKAGKLDASKLGYVDLDRIGLTPYDTWTKPVQDELVRAHGLRDHYTLAEADAAIQATGSYGGLPRRRPGQPPR